MRRSALASSCLLALSPCLAAQSLFADVRKQSMDLEVAQTVQLFPGDIDGDGLLDLIANRWTSLRYQTPRSFAMRNEHGHFIADPGPATPLLQPGALACADLDRDGDLDVVFATDIGVNDGHGAFTIKPLPAPFAAYGAYPDRAAVGDVDGDGNADVFTSALYLGLGRLSFALALTQLPNVPSSPLPAFADVDRDGDLDLVIADASATGQTRLYLNGGIGFFTDVTATHLPAHADAARDLVIADVDGDGWVDILVASFGSPVRLFRNRGDGTFDDASHLVHALIGPTWCVAAGDIDADGDVDLVLGDDNGCQILENQGAIAGFVPDASGRWQPVPGSVRDALLLDVDADGDLDLVEARAEAPPVRGYGVENRIEYNDGRGRFRSGADDPIRIATSHGRAALGDLDGDGNVDLLLCDASGTVLFGDGRAGFDSATLALNLPLPGLPRLADLDRDGDLDAIVLHDTGFDVLANPGNGRLVVSNRYAFGGLGVGSAAADAVLADFDGDGALDVFVATHGRWLTYFYGVEREQLWLGDGTGRFHDGSSLLPAGLTTASSHVAAGDLDGDGDIDAVVDGSIVYLNLAGQGFSAVSFFTQCFDEASSLSVADMDGDGDLDVVAGNTCFFCGGAEIDGAANCIMFNDGRGNLAGKQITASSFTHTFDTATADFDEDGDVDIVFGNVNANSPQEQLFSNDRTWGTGMWITTQPAPFPEDFDDTYAVLARDLDHDGDVDLVMVNDQSPGVTTPRSKVYVNLTRHLTTPDLARLGRPYRMWIDGAHGGAVLLLAAGPSTPSIPTVFGVLGLDPLTLLPVGILGPPGQGARIALDLVMPSLPALAGATLWWQALVVGTSGPRFTNVVADPVTAH